MTATARYPATASVYEVVRMRPGAKARLETVGLTREHYSLRIRDAARALGVPVERITEIVEGQPEE